MDTKARLTEYKREVKNKMHQQIDRWVDSLPDVVGSEYYPDQYCSIKFHVVSGCQVSPDVVGYIVTTETEAHLKELV